MAGGIDWFRWHHGSVNDPKFQLVARRAVASVAEVIAVWAMLLESASMHETRGYAGEQDFEAMDCALGLSEGKSLSIYEAMQARELLDVHGHVVRWDRRQPKREDDNAAVRKRRQRDRDDELNACVTSSESRDVTRCHAESRRVTQSHDRGEESREDIPSLSEKAGGLALVAQLPPPFSGDTNESSIPPRARVMLASGCELPESWGTEAEALGWQPAEILKESEKFRQYFVSGKGLGTRRSVKGWRQSWSNWLGNAERYAR